MYGPSTRTKINGHCREMAVRGGSAVLYAKELQVHMKDYKQGLKQNIKNILVIAIAMDNQTSDLTAVPTQLSGSVYQRVMFQRNAVVSFTVYHLVFVLFCIGLSVGVTIAVGLLLYYQIKGIVSNKTAIEIWIVEKANRLREEGMTFTYPYDLGWKENIKQVITLKRDYIGDGITWPVVEGCDQYSLTREQLEQKKLKKERKICYSIVKPYNGNIIAWREGLRTCFSAPCSDEPRMKLQTGESVLVSRWRKYWLYGEKSAQLFSGLAGGAIVREKGWFPRQCTGKEEEEETVFKKDI